MLYMNCEPLHLHKIDSNEPFHSVRFVRELGGILCFRESSHRGFAVFHAVSIYAVWDFMSLLKKLQQAYAPHGAPWLPSPENGRLIRFINEIVMEEESDLSFGSESENYSSHFEIYLESMKEVQCPVDEVLSFMGRIRDRGLEDGLNYDKVPSPSRKFMRHTFEVINAGRPHEVAASLPWPGKRHSFDVQKNSQVDQGIQEDAPSFTTTWKGMPSWTETTTARWPKEFGGVA